MGFDVKSYVQFVRKLFGLDKEPYLEIDDYLILLTTSPSCKHFPDENAAQLRQLYQACDYESLEFYGDRVLYTIIAMILSSAFKLKLNPGLLTEYSHFLASNKTFTSLFEDKCVQLHKYPKTFKPKHNVCGDTFEATVGMLFYHFYIIKQNIQFIEIIYDWVVTNTGIIQFLTNKLEEDNQYQYLSEAIVSKNVRGVKPTTDLEQELAPPKAIVYVTPTTTLEEIYEKLGWNKPVIYTQDDVYVLDGVINDKEWPIAIGFTQEELVENAKEWLLTHGYINMKKIVKRVPKTTKVINLKQFLGKEYKPNVSPTKAELIEQFGKHDAEELIRYKQQEISRNFPITISNNLSLEKIYQKLNWGKPEFYKVDELVVIDGYVNGKKASIALGTSKQETEQNARLWLLENGYIQV